MPDICLRNSDIGTEKSRPFILTKWSSAAAAVRGDATYKGKAPCQDVVHQQSVGGTTVIALADGAGSADLSHFGAQVIVKETCALLLREYDLVAAEPISSAQDRIVDHLKRALVVCAQANQCRVDDLASTLLFVAVRKSSYIAGSLGDGIVGGRRNGIPVPLFLPQRGEFANETIFVTSSRAATALRVMRGSTDDTDAFVLMSDGTAESLYLKAEARLGKGVLTIWQWQDKNAPNTVVKALDSSLRDTICKKTKDDCSIAVLCRTRKSIEELERESAEFKRFFLSAKDNRSARALLAVAHEMCNSAPGTPIRGLEGMNGSQLRGYRRWLCRTFPNQFGGL